jgi:putative heme-binding domain-containing protein
MQRLAINSSLTESQRRAIIKVLIQVNPLENLPLLEKILLNSGEQHGVRDQAALSLGALNIAKANEILVKALVIAPARLEKSIALALAGNRDGGELLLEAVAQGKASARLLQDRPVEVGLGRAKIPDLPKRLADLTRGLPTPDQRVSILIEKKKNDFVQSQANPVKGKKVFETHCAICHQIQNLGTKIGPQIDGIGIRGLERLLEDILDPNRNVDQAFRATTLNLKNGQQVSGLVLRQEGQVLLLADALGKEMRIPLDKIEERVVTPLSPMPANFTEVIPGDEFNDLMAYLLSQRVK